MRRHSSEAYLISALVSLRDAHAAQRLGITPEMFAGYQAEYRFLMSYQQTYGECPSPEVLVQRFPSFSYTPNEDVRFSADDVRDEYNRRELAKAVRSTVEQLRFGDLDAALLEWNSFAPVTGTKSLVDSLADDGFLEHHGEFVDSVPVPWDTLQACTGGIGPGQFWTFAARMGMGKSWTALVIARDAILAGRRVVFWSMEMPRKQVHQRMHALLAPCLNFGVTFNELKGGTYSKREYRDLLASIRDNVMGNLFVLDSSDLTITPAAIAGHADAADLHIVDHLGLMRGSAGGRAVDDWRNMAVISNELKEIALAKKTRVVALSQINREGDTGTWRPPRAKFLSQSDAIGQDSDVVVTMRRFSNSTMVYLLDKNRDGPSDRLFWSHFNVDTANFAEITRETAEHIKDNEDYDD